MNKLSPQTGLPLRPSAAAQLPQTIAPQIRRAAELVLSEQPSVKYFSSEELKDELYEPMSAVAFLLGHSNVLASGKSLQLMGTALAAVIHRRFPALKLAEITEAFVRGASGEWPLPNGFLAPTLPNFTHWLVCYQEQCRSRALQELRGLQEAQRQLPPPTIDESNLPALVARWAQDFQRTGTFPPDLDPLNLVYDWLKRIGGFAGFKTPAQYAKLIRKESIKLSRHRQGSLGERNALKSFREQLRRGWPQDHPLAKSVRNNCKKALLREWIRYKLSVNFDFEKVLTWKARIAAEVNRAA